MHLAFLQATTNLLLQRAHVFPFLIGLYSQTPTLMCSLAASPAAQCIREKGGWLVNCHADQLARFGRWREPWQWHGMGESFYRTLLQSAEASAYTVQLPD